MPRGYVVLDFETTGFSPKYGDRVVELGAVQLSPELVIKQSLETLVNPLRDVGPTRIHGITARDVLDAPTFDQVAPALIEMLDGRVIVGHNIAFDLRFLEAELRREGFEVPEFVAIDTLEVSRAMLKDQALASFKLHEVGAHLGYTLDKVCEIVEIEARAEHSAFGDALVTAFMLSHFIQLAPGSQFWSSRLERAEMVLWPECVAFTSPSKRRGDNSASQLAAQRSVIDVVQAVGGAPATAPTTDAYAVLLDSAMRDRVLDSGEVDALIETARRLGLEAATLGSLHRGLFDRVVGAAWEDGVLAADELADVERVAILLGIDADSLRAATVPPDRVTPLPHGSLIALTGDMSRPREQIEEELLRLGYVPASSVNKKTRLLIAADPHTQSGKAKRAKELGIPVVGELEGLRLLGA